MLSSWSDNMIPVDENGNEILQLPPSQSSVHMNGVASVDENSDEYEGGPLVYIAIFAGVTALAYVVSKMTGKASK